MKKEAYETAEIDVIVFHTEDVIITSTKFNPDPNEGGPVVG